MHVMWMQYYVKHFVQLFIRALQKKTTESANISSEGLGCADLLMVWFSLLTTRFTLHLTGACVVH